MSYILDALRRLEQDKEMTKRGANPMEAVLVPDLDRDEKPERRRLWWMGLGIVLLVSAIAATYWITRHTLAPRTEHARNGTVPHLSSAQPGYDRSEPASFPEAASSAFQPPPSARQRAAPSTTWVTSSDSGEAPSSPPLRRPAEVLDASVPIPPAEGSRPGVSTDGGVLPVRQERAALSREASEGEVIQDWTGSEIKINAIAYSRNSKNRFAVVNLKTIHEGDRFEDLAVVEIQENGIVFERDGTRYRVLLGKR